MNLYLILDTWPTQGDCWECPGESGVDWLAVQAAEAGDALALAAERFRLESYDEAHTLYAFQLRETQGRKPRLLAHSDFTLEAESAGVLRVWPPPYQREG